MLKNILTSMILTAWLPLAMAGWSEDPSENNPVAVKDGELVQPRMALLEDGSAYVSWLENTGSGYDVRIQRMDANGNPMWDVDGILVADRDFTSTEAYGLDVDADGYAVLAFRDDRFGGTRITANRVSADGDLEWGSDGVQLSEEGPFVASPRIAGASDGSIVAAWHEDGDTELVSLDSGGAEQWSETVSLENGTTISALHASDEPGQNGQVIALIATLDGFLVPRHLFAQKFDSQGDALWGEDPVTVDEGGSMQFGYFPDFVPDQAGGLAVAWYRSDPLQVYVQHLDADGEPRLADNGLAVSTLAGQVRTDPDLALDSAGQDLYVFWRETDDLQSQVGLYGQHIDDQGERAWGEDGAEFISLSPDPADDIIQVRAAMVEGDPVVSFVSGSSGDGRVLEVARIDSQADPVWDPAYTIVSDTGSDISNSVVAEVNGSALYLAWQDNRLEDNDIYMQRLAADGQLGGAPVTEPGVPNLLMRSGPDGAFQIPPGTTWSSKTPRINSHGRVGMSVNSVAGTGDAGIWSGDADGGGIVDTVDEDGALYFDVGINDAGQIVWVRGESSENGILQYDPDDDETTFLTNAPLGASSWGSVDNNNAGQVGYRAGFGGGGGNAWVSWDPDDGAEVHLAESDSDYTFLFSPSINNNRLMAGKAAFQSNTTNQIIVVDADGDIVVLVEDDDLDPDSPFSGFDNSVGFNDAGQVAFISSLAAGGRGVFVADSDGWTQYAVEGEDGLDDIEFFSPSLNGDGQVSFRGFNDQGQRAIWVADGSSVEQVATQGDEVEIDVGTAILDISDGFSPGDPNFGGSPDINGVGQVTFVSLLTDPDDSSINYGRGVFLVETAPTEPVPELTLTKSADPHIYDTVGQTISYTYVVENTGDEALDGPLAVDDDQEAVDCPEGDLAPGNTITCTAEREISEADMEAGQVTNVATATMDGVDSSTVEVTIFTAELFEDRFEAQD